MLPGSQWNHCTEKIQSLSIKAPPPNSFLLLPCSYSVIILQKNSPATKYVNRVCQKIFEAGLVGYRVFNLWGWDDKSFTNPDFRKYLTEYLPAEALLKPRQPRLALRPIALLNFVSSNRKNFYSWNYRDCIILCRLCLLWCWTGLCSHSFPFKGIYRAQSKARRSSFMMAFLKKQLLHKTMSTT